MPVSPHQRDAYASQMSAMIQRARDLNDRAAEGVPALVSDALKEINNRIASLPPSQWTVQTGLPTIRAEVARAAKEMGVAVYDEVVGGLASAAKAGSAAVLDPLVGQGIIAGAQREAFAVIPASLLNVASGFASDLITELQRDARDTIAGYVRRSIITGKSQIQVMQDIAQAIDYGGGSALQFGSIFNRAEVIYRTETSRMLSMSTRVRGTQLDEMFPGMRKRWLKSAKRPGREDHEAMEERTKRAPLLMDEWYEFGEYALMYPVDPNGRGSERALAAGSIGCGCDEVYEPPVGGAKPRDPGDVDDATSAVIDDVQALAEAA